MSGLEEGSGREKGVCVRKGYQLVDGALRPEEKREEKKKGLGRADVRQRCLESQVTFWSRTLARPSPGTSQLSTRASLLELCQIWCR